MKKSNNPKTNKPKNVTKENSPLIYSTRKFMVLDTDGKHEYDIIVDETDKGSLFSIYLSNGSQWNEHAKGELSMTMLDTGNGVVFTPSLSELDYSQLNYVRLLTGLELELDSNPKNKEKYNLIEVKEIIKL